MNAKHIIAIVCGGLMALCVFLPWAGAGGGGISISFSPFASSPMGSNPLLIWGIFGLLLGIGGVVMAILKATRKFTVIIGGLSLIDAIIGFIVIASKGEGYLSPQFGLILFTLAAIGYLVVSIMLLRNPE